MEKKSFKDFVTHIKESLQGGLETARSEGIPKKIAAIVFGMIALSLVFVLLLRALDVLFNAISQFVNQHFPSIAAATAGGSFLFMRHNERKVKLCKNSSLSPMCSVNASRKDAISELVTSSIVRFVQCQIFQI